MSRRRRTYDEIVMRHLQRAFAKAGDEGIPQEKINAVIKDASDFAGEGIANSLRATSRSMLIDHASLRRGFEVRLRDVWGEALDALYALYVVAVEAAEEYFKRTRDEAIADEDVVWSALLRIQARACHVASEIQALLRSGHAEGAQARWRTLHELTVVAAFISENDDEVARRYLEHEAITIWKDALQYQKHAARLEFEPYTDEEMASMKEDRDRLVAKHGQDYLQDWGWAAGYLNGPLGFATIEEATQVQPLAALL